MSFTAFCIFAFDRKWPWNLVLNNKKIHRSLFNHTGQRLQQLNRRDKHSLIQTAMQNLEVTMSENVLSGISYLNVTLLASQG